MLKNVHHSKFASQEQYHQCWIANIQSKLAYKSLRISLIISISSCVLFVGNKDSCGKFFGCNSDQN